MRYLLAITTFLLSIHAISAQTIQAKPLRGAEGLSFCIAFSSDGRHIATGGKDGTVTLWDAASRKEVRTFTGHSRPVMAVVFAPKGDYLVSGSMDQTVRIWSTDDAKKVESFKLKDGGEPTDALTCVAISPDEKWIAASGWDKRIHLWEKSSKNESVLPTEQGAVFGLAFSPDSKRLASGSQFGTVHIWDVAKKIADATLLGTNKTVWSVAWKADSNTLAASAGNEVLIWNVADKKTTAALKGHLAPIRSLVFTDKDNLLVTGSEDRTVRVWDMMKNQSLNVLTGPEGLIYSVASSPDGKRIGAVAHDSTQSTWVWVLEKK